MGPDTFRKSWVTQVVEGRMSLRYTITATAAVAGVGELCEVTAYMHAGVWTPEHTERIALPMFDKDIEGVVKELSFDEWDSKYSQFGAYPMHDASHAFVGAMPFTLAGVEYVPPVESCELFLGKGDGWRIEIPDGAMHTLRDKDGGVKTSKWTSAQGIEVVRTQMGVRGFDVAWLLPPLERVVSVVTARAAHRREELKVLGEKPCWVRR